MAKIVTVFDPDGNPEKHSLANARDLVNGAGWSWDPNKPAHPLDPTPAPYVPSREERLKLDRGPAVSQEIFDSIGTKAMEEIRYTETADEEIPLPAVMPASVSEEVRAVEEQSLVEETKSVDLPRAGSRRFGKDKG